jgi:acyl carrier protein
MTGYRDARSIILNALVGIKCLPEERRDALIADSESDVELASLGITSMAVIDLCMDIEEHTGREILIEELIDNATLNKLAALIGEEP